MPWKAMAGHGCGGATPWAVVKSDTGEKVSCHASKAKAQAQVKLLYAKEDQMNAASAGCGCDHGEQAERAVDNSAWDGNAAMTACSDAACYRAICAGRKAGPASERGSWALPHHKRPGSPPNAAGVRNSLARFSQTQGLTNREAARRHLEAHMRSIQAGANAAPPDGETRSVPFALERADGHGDGLTLEGYAAVFDTPTRIAGWDGDFDEVIKRGAFARTLAERMPKLMFEHGRHPLVGQMPLGVIQEAREDAKGLFIQARLSDNWLIQPVRDAVRDGAVDGMSFRFQVPEGGDTRRDRKDDVPLRTLTDIDVAELGPVVFPAYEPTTASVRSLAERLHDDDTGRPDARSAGGGDPDPAPEQARSAPDPLDDPQRRDLHLRTLGVIRG